MNIQYYDKVENSFCIFTANKKLKKPIFHHHYHIVDSIRFNGGMSFEGLIIDEDQ